MLLLRTTPKKRATAPLSSLRTWSTRRWGSRGRLVTSNSTGASAHGRDEGQLVAVPQGVFGRDVFGVDSEHEAVSVVGQGGVAPAEEAVRLARAEALAQLHLCLPCASQLAQAGEQAHPGLHGESSLVHLAQAGQGED